MSSTLITEQSRFDELCQEIESAGEVAFDTEFVSEFTYRPELCLLQFATRQRAVAVDPYRVPDLSRWWQIMAGGKVAVVIHGGREEIRFCWRFAGQAPGNLWDIQLAEGLQSRSYPLSYTSLVHRVLGKVCHGKETRTDWRRRPLSDRQIAYALEDVAYLLEIRDRQAESLRKRGRYEWVITELTRMIDDLRDEVLKESWRKLSGLGGLSSRELAVVRELWLWREREAEYADRPARKMLRDDLIVELARRQPVDVADLMSSRDLNRSDYKKLAPAMLGAIQKGLAVPSADLPTIRRTEKDQDEHILAQLLSIALANRCSQAEVAVQLVGTSADLKQLVRWQVYGDRTGPVPRILEGWRGEVCGELLTDMLAGKISLRVSDPQSDHPLTFERLDANRPLES